MTTLTVTAKGQITLKKEILQKMGVRPGDKIEIELLPSGEIRGRAAPKKGSIEDVFGMLAGKSDVRLTIEEMNDAIAEAAAEAGMAGLTR